MTDSKAKLEALRKELSKQGVDGFLVPRADEYQGEYVPACSERLKWLTGFTGSAGVAAVLPEKAVVMSDGRYTIQLRAQVDANSFETADMIETPVHKWLAENGSEGLRIGYDPKLHTAAQVTVLQEKLELADMELVCLESNPLDAVWVNRPSVPMGKVEIFPEEIAGRSTVDKHEEIAKAVQDGKGIAVVLGMPDSIAWLLNIRGADIPHIPIALSYAIVYEDAEMDWFIDAGKLDDAVRVHIGNKVRVRTPEELEAAMEELADAAQKKNLPVLVDFKRAPAWFAQQLEKAGAVVNDFTDPCILPKARKSAAEQKAIREAHVLDGVALVRFLKWLEEEAPNGALTELDVEARLEQFRRMSNLVTDSSFDTIAGWADHGAIVHYRATEETNARIIPPGLLLVDSGAQYRYGTTDVTRTMAIGEPTEEMCTHFTLVLKGHIAVAMARFPEGTTGDQIDALARGPLWRNNLDYDHGTGHGVGCYLSVHEEAAAITPRNKDVAFEPGMLISNEPGYYLEGAYGIRIESLVFVREAGPREDGKRKMLRFETITMAPIDRTLIVADMLDEAERCWLNEYHALVREMLSPHLNAEEKVWLAEATQPL